MALQERYDFSSVVNQAEQWIIDEVEEQLSEKPELLESEEAVLDIVALALNHTRPHYHATLLGAIYARELDQEHQKEIKKSVSDAIKKIEQNPS
jgi:predicted DNA-binding transcriptional regulator